MRFLCIHGACTNGETMQTSLYPLLEELKDDKDLIFYYAQGYLDSTPPTWLEGYLGGPPYLRFFQWDSALLDQGYQRYNEETTAKSTENVDKGEMTLFAEYVNKPPEPWSIGVALEYLRNVMEEEGPFQGIIGISEGASVAATLLINDLDWCRTKKTVSSFRCGLFYIGAPPWTSDGTRPLLAEEFGHPIQIPTCHIKGAADVFVEGADQLYEVCEPDLALSISDPVGGHRMPKDKGINEKIAEWIREQKNAFSKA